jgi:hypothetical protein
MVRSWGQYGVPPGRNVCRIGFGQGGSPVYHSGKYALRGGSDLRGRHRHCWDGTMSEPQASHADRDMLARLVGVDLGW